MIQFLINSVVEKNYQTAYIYAFLIIIFLFLSTIFKHNSIYNSALLNNQLKGAIVFILFNKISRVSQYMLKSTDMGKIVNMIANDFNSMEIKLNYFCIALGFPITMIGILIVIVYRLGWWGLMCLIIPICIIPIQGYLGKKSG